MTCAVKRALAGTVTSGVGQEASLQGRTTAVNRIYDGLGRPSYCFRRVGPAQRRPTSNPRGIARQRCFLGGPALVPPSQDLVSAYHLSADGGLTPSARWSGQTILTRSEKSESRDFPLSRLF